MSDFRTAVEERLVRYVQVDTESDAASPSVPSTPRQLDLLRMLQEELAGLGAADVKLTESGFVIGTVPSNVQGDVPRVAFMAHVDTTQQFNGFGVKPIVHRAYDGSPIALPDDPTKVLDPATNSPYLGTKVGDDIITASGTTLLGADDKAGVAIVMTLAEHLLAHPDMKHGDIRICFTPDEEIGRGIDGLDLADLDADYGYTLDGSVLGELVYETFSADGAAVTITGVSIHPGDAFGKLVNALHLASKVLLTLPQHTRTPETTRGREGFIHCTTMEGSAAQARLSFILRDFDRDGLQQQGDILRAVCAAVQASEPRAQVEVTIKPQYRNMRYWLENDMRPIDVAVRAMEKQGVEPVFNPIRGGTDGSKLTERGLLTPNIFTGMQNIHGPLEWVSVPDMARSTEVCVAIAEEWALT